mgnify:FL=1
MNFSYIWIIGASLRILETKNAQLLWIFFQLQVHIKNMKGNIDVFFIIVIHWCQCILSRRLH